MYLADQNSYSERHGWATIGGLVGSAFALPLLGETIAQVDLLRNVKGLKPMLKGDTFDHLKKRTNSNVFEYITKNKKMLYSSLLKKFGVASLAVACGVTAGRFLDNLHQKYKYMP